MKMFNNIASRTRFLYQQRTTGFEISDTPHMDDLAKAYFLDRLSRCSSYLEYGCGGSTIEAARQKKASISVESDRYYMESVRRKIISLGYTPDQLIHADIGITAEWGYPMFEWRTSRRLQQWKQYAQAPWKQPIDPDLILIDGRFRVHCALYSISQSREFEMLFDDYEGRPYYRPVEEFSVLKRMVGRMGVFEPRTDIDNARLLVAIERFAGDCR